MSDRAKTQGEDKMVEAPDFETSPGPIEWPPKDYSDDRDADFDADPGDAEKAAEPSGTPEIEAPLLELTQTEPDAFPYFSYILLFLVVAMASALVVLMFG